MKILCVIDSLGSGGAQRQIVELAKGFKEKEHEVTFLVYHNINFFKKILDQNSISVFSIIEPNYFKRLIKMRRFIRKGKYDAVLSFLEASNFICEIAALPYRKWKLIVGERSSDPRILKSFKLRLYRGFHLFADYVVANSTINIEMVKKINPLLSNKKCKVVYNMIDSNYWKPQHEHTYIKDNNFNIVVAASHQYLKNAKGLIEAINLLPKDLKEKTQVNWYGDESPDKSYNENLSLIKKYNLESIIIFHKATDKIKEKMESADAIGLFSFHEGLPNVICEAMSMGKPILTSTVSDLPALLNNTNNFLFNPNYVDELKDKLISLLNTSVDELQKIGIDNRNFSLELFNREMIINNYLNLFK